ncbi:hypothetical protein VTI74DRAFT_8924 [Chaetomium olivicolor]
MKKQMWSRMHVSRRACHQSNHAPRIRQGVKRRHLASQHLANQGRSGVFCPEPRIDCRHRPSRDGPIVVWPSPLSPRVDAPHHRLARIGQRSRCSSRGQDNDYAGKGRVLCCIPVKALMGCSVSTLGAIVYRKIDVADTRPCLAAARNLGESLLIAMFRLFDEKGKSVGDHQGHGRFVSSQTQGTSDTRRFRHRQRVPTTETNGP